MAHQLRLQRRGRRCRGWWWLTAGLWGAQWASAAMAQAPPALDALDNVTVWEQWRQRWFVFGRDEGAATLEVGALLSGWIDLSPATDEATPDGLVVTDARVALRGTVGRVFSWRVQVDPVQGAAAVVDAYGAWTWADTVTLRLGRMKVPFSGELLIDDAAIDYNELSRAVSAFAPGRAVGAQASVSGWDGLLFGHAGLFAGDLRLDGIGAQRWAALRAGLHQRWNNGQLTGAVNAAWGRPEGPAESRPPPSRTRWGMDVRLTWRTVFVAAEVLAEVRPAAVQSFGAGGYATVSWSFVPYASVLVRWDLLYTPRDGVQHWVVPSIAFALPSLAPAQFQLDAAVPLGPGDTPRVLFSGTFTF